MDQSRLNRIWDLIVVTGEEIDGVIGREGRSQDYLVQLSDGTLWCRSHDANVWRLATPVKSSGIANTAPRATPDDPFDAASPVQPFGVRHDVLASFPSSSMSCL